MCGPTMKSVSWCILVVAVTVSSAATLDDPVRRVAREPVKMATGTTYDEPIMMYERQPPIALSMAASAATAGLPVFREDSFNRVKRESVQMNTLASVDKSVKNRVAREPVEMNTLVAPVDEPVKKVAMEPVKMNTGAPLDEPVKRVAMEHVQMNTDSPVDEPVKRVARESSEEDESCKPTKPVPGTNMCCDLPLVFRGSPELFKACIEELGLPDHKQSPPPSSEGRGPPPHHKGPPPHRGMACVSECLFNRSGLLESGKLNKEALKKALDEYLKTDGAWKEVATSTLNKCYDAQTKGDFKPDNEKFVSGSSEFQRCFSRDLFMHCIPEKWTDSKECVEMKEKLEKCPKMLPPAIFFKHPH